MNRFVNNIICGDSLEVLKQMPTGFVALTVTSPPYNVGMGYNSSNDRQDYSKYLAYMKEILTEVYRVTMTGGRIVINLPSSILQSTYSRAAYMSLDYVNMMRDIGWLDREWITWVKISNGGVVGKNTAWGSWLSPSKPYLRDASEMIIVMDKESHKRCDRRGHNDITKEEFMKFTTNVWLMRPVRSKYHPAPFPMELPYRAIKLYTWPGDIVLDPFVGSGTTAIVANQTHRKYIGIDVSGEYCNIARKQIQDSLF